MILIGTGDGSKTVYQYYVNGKKYKYVGHVESSGAATPYIGDKEILKYNPDNPKGLIKFFIERNIMKNI